MTDEFTNDNNNNLNDSSINKAKLAAEEFGKQEKIRKLKEAAEEIRKHANKKREEIENEACNYFNSLLSNIDLNSGRSYSRTFNSEFNPEEEEDYFTDGIGSILAKLFKFFNFVASALGMGSALGMDAEAQTYKKIIREKKENWIAAIMKLLKDKFNAIVKKILAKDLSFKERLVEEIKSLIDKINSGELSEEELAEAVKRLQLLQNIKIRMQMFAVGWVIVMLSELLSVELKVSAEIEVDEDKKEEKIPPKEKETTKEAYAKIEAKIEVTSKEMPKIIIPESIIDFSSGAARPIPLTKAERDLLPDFLRNGLPPIFKDDMKIENREAPKQSEVKQENKQAEPKKEVSSPKPAEQPATNTMRVKPREDYGCSSRRERKISAGSNNNYRQISSQPAQRPIFNKNISQQSARSSVADYEYDFTVGFGAGDETKQSSVENVEEKVLSGVTDIKSVDKHVEGQSVGKPSG